MEMYFRFKMFIAIIIWFAVLASFIYFLCQGILITMKSSMMEKAGFKYDKGLGRCAAYEYQPHYKRGNLKIHVDEIYDMPLIQLSGWIKNNKDK